MRILRYLFAIALVCSLVRVAKADDFAMVVVDPLPSASEVNLITNANFAVTLSTCNSDQLFGLTGGPWLGCFTGMNLTGAPLTTLEVLVPIFNYPTNSPQSASCPTTGFNQVNAFSTVSCGGTTPDGKDFILDFSGLPGIAAATGTNGDCDNDHDGGSGLNADDIECNQHSIFTIAEAGVPVGNFPTFNVEGNAALTPEPNSIWLLSSGILSLGSLGVYRRRRLPL